MIPRATIKHVLQVCCAYKWLPATSIVQEVLAQAASSFAVTGSSRCLRLADDKSRRTIDSAYLCTRQREATPTILVSKLHDLHSALGKRARFPFSPFVKGFQICEVLLAGGRLLVDGDHKIVHISHSQGFNLTFRRGLYPEARFSGQRAPVQSLHICLHTLPPRSRSVDQTVH